MTPLLAYNSFGVILAVLALFQTIKVRKNAKPKTTISFIGFCELVWVAVSLFVIFHDSFTGLYMVAPIIYVSQFAVCWMYASNLLIKTGEIHKDDPKDINIPPQLIDYSIATSLTYLALSLFTVCLYLQVITL